MLDACPSNHRNVDRLYHELAKSQYQIEADGPLKVLAMSLIIRFRPPNNTDLEEKI
jgi:hypothetical protein